LSDEELLRARIVRVSTEVQAEHFLHQRERIRMFLRLIRKQARSCREGGFQGATGALEEIELLANKALGE
jgi:hypothetical protein